MSGELQVMGRAAVPEGLPEIDAAAVEKVLLQGDLAKLEPSQRLAYYNSVCKSLKLNPLTRPFEYIVLNGKMVLYAKRECTEQLRKIYAVSIVILERSILEGVFLVRAQAVMPSGRTDESIGAVGIEGLKGEARALAMMKCETRAKRRVTLSICGMAFMDESESDGVRGAYEIPVDPHTGAIQDIPTGKDLHEDIGDHPVPEPTKGRTRAGTSFDVLKYFGEIKARYRKAGAEAGYYAVLSRYGHEHADQFQPDAEGLQQARNCYKEMQLDVADIEAQAAMIPVCKRLPDPAPLVEGSLMRQGGKTWAVRHGAEGSEWVETQP